MSDGKNNAKKNTTYYTFGANKFVPVSSQPLARKGLPIKTYSRTTADLGQIKTYDTATNDTAFNDATTNDTATNDTATNDTTTNDTTTPNKPDPTRGTGGTKTNAQVSVIKTLPKMTTLPTILTETTIMTMPAINTNKPGPTIMIEPTMQANDTILTTFDTILPAIDTLIPVHTSTEPENNLATLKTPSIEAEPLSPASQFQATMDTILDDEVMRTGEIGRAHV